MKVYIVWNDEIGEGVVFDDYSDALATAKGQSGWLPVIGDQFREIYDEVDEFEIIETTIKEPKNDRQERV